MDYLGHLPKNDPLYEYIRWEIQEKINLSGSLEYRVFKMRASNNVYLYEETQSNIRIIGKFYFRNSSIDRHMAHQALTHEYECLNYMRTQGFCGEDCHYIARPLGMNSDLNELLLEEACYGETLTNIIERSIQENNTKLLYEKLTALAFFLSKFHNRTAIANPVDFRPVTQYARRMADYLLEKNYISNHRHGKMHQLFSNWGDWPIMWSDNQVVVHGDATPENFLFGDGMHVISFDLERLRRADRLFDVGRLAAELGHFFQLHTHSRINAEPFIGHFIWEYSCHFPDREAAFAAITQRLPFYMGINYLRIARNSYFSWDYRQSLLNAGMECLKGGLK